MGFMRKALFLGTGGLSGMAGVRANSKKERTAKAAEKQVRLQRQVLRATQAPTVAPRTTATPVGLDSPGRLARAARREARERAEPTFAVVLTAIDPSQRSPTVQVVRDVTDLAQEACERLIDELPSVINTGIDRATGEALKARFGDFRATAELKPQSTPPPVVPPAPAPEPNGLSDELDRIAALHRDGTLTDAEFAAAKAKILGAKP